MRGEQSTTELFLKFLSGIDRLVKACRKLGHGK